MTRAPFYPRADRASQWFSTRTSPARTSNRLVLWHTTEMGVPGEPWPTYTYNGMIGGSAPHWTVKPDRANRRLLWRQHWRADESARALAHPAGTPETNNSGVLQIELGGTSVKGDPGYYWGDPDDWALRDLADFSSWAYAEWGIPLTDEGRLWHALSRNASGYIVQSGGSTRLSWAAWQAARGHSGHEHAPGNDHLDPGPFPARRMLSMATTGDESMSAADVADLKAYFDAKLDQMLGGRRTVGDAVVNGVTFGSKTFGALVVEASRADDANLAVQQMQASISALAGLTPAAVADEVIARLGGTGGGFDIAQLRYALEQVLDAKLPTTFVAQPPGQQPAPVER